MLHNIKVLNKYIKKVKKDNLIGDERERGEDDDDEKRRKVVPDPYQGSQLVLHYMVIQLVTTFPFLQLLHFV